MFYYKAKDGRSTLALKKPLAAENYPEYTEEMIAGYEEATKEEVCPHCAKSDDGTGDEEP